MSDYKVDDYSPYNIKGDPVHDYLNRNKGLDADEYPKPHKKAVKPPKLIHLFRSNIFLNITMRYYYNEGCMPLYQLRIGLCDYIMSLNGNEKNDILMAYFKNDKRQLQIILYNYIQKLCQMN
jgi:hypothetical protein